MDALVFLCLGLLATLFVANVVFSVAVPLALVLTVLGVLTLAAWSAGNRWAKR